MGGSSERTKRAIDAVFDTHSGGHEDVDEDHDEEVTEQKDGAEGDDIDDKDNGR